MTANQLITLPRPPQRRPLGIRHIHPPQPPPRALVPLPPTYLPLQRPGPFQRLRIRLPPHPSTHHLLSNTRIPHVVQIQHHPIKPDLNSIPAPRHIFSVQRLVNIPHKMHHKLGRDLALVQRQRRVEEPRRVVGEGGDDAARGFAVAREVDGARGGGRVLGVDEVEGRGEAVVLGVAEGVGPGGDAGEVRGGGVGEEGLEVGGGRGGDEGGSEVGDGDVPEAWRGGLGWGEGGGCWEGMGDGLPPQAWAAGRAAAAARAAEDSFIAGWW